MGKKKISADQIDEALSLLEGKQHERRRHPRKKVDMPITFLKKNLESELVVDPKKEDHQAKIIDLSKGGVAIQTKNVFHINEIFYIIIQNTETLFSIELKNVRLKDKSKEYFQYGCEFLTIIKDEEKHITW